MKDDESMNEMLSSGWFATVRIANSGHSKLRAMSGHVVKKKSLKAAIPIGFDNHSYDSAKLDCHFFYSFPDSLVFHIAMQKLRKLQGLCLLQCSNYNHLFYALTMYINCLLFSHTL